jgi:hypothetical protein
MALDTDRSSGSRGAPPLLRVTGPADLAQAIPYLLGFHPSRSLVVVGLRAKRVAVTARIDLDDLVGTPVLRETLASFACSGAEKVVAVVFDDEIEPRADGDELAWYELADEVHVAAGRQGLDVDEVALVSHGRLWSYDCADPRCCPPEGRVLGGNSSQIAATAAYAGLVALPDRADLVAQLASRVDRDELAGLLDELRARERAGTGRSGTLEQHERDRADARAVLDAARAFDEPGEAELTDAQRLDFAVALRRIAVRDAVWMALDADRIDGRALWQRLATSVPAPYDAAPLFLFGWASYRDGNGALARIAADRALDSDPYYSAADLILAALSQALDPRRLPRFTRRDIREAQRAGRPGGGGRKRR